MLSTISLQMSKGTCFFPYKSRDLYISITFVCWVGIKLKQQPIRWSSRCRGPFDLDLPGHHCLDSGPGGQLIHPRQKSSKKPAWYGENVFVFECIFKIWVGEFWSSRIFSNTCLCPKSDQGCWTNTWHVPWFAQRSMVPSLEAPGQIQTGPPQDPWRDICLSSPRHDLWDAIATVKVMFSWKWFTVASSKQACHPNLLAAGGRFFGAKVIQLTQANQGLEADTMGRTSGERKAPWIS